MIILGALFAWLLRAVMVDPVPIEIDPIPPDPFAGGDPIPIDSFEYPPPWLPGIEGTQPYEGLGALPVWDDVYNYAESTFNERYAGGLNISQDLRSQGGLDIGRTAIGSAIRAVSGFINQTVEMMQRQFTDVAQTLQFVLGGLDATDRELYSRILKLQAEVSGLSAIAAYEERQIVALKETIFDAARFETAYLQDWVRRTVTEPLLRAIVEQDQSTDRKILTTSRNVLDQAHADTLTQLAPVAAAVAVATRAITALQTESDECVKPMCSVMGPGTNLGKLLKGLSLVAELAALADLLSLTEPELAAKIGEAIGKVAGYVTEFEGYFASGTETLGDVLGNITGGLL